MAFITPAAFPRTSRIGQNATSPVRGRRATMAVAQPTFDRVVVRVDKAEAQTDGGLFLGTEHEKEKNSGTVVSVGPGRFSPEGKREEISLQPGDHVMWKDNYGAEVVQSDKPDEELLALKAFSIVAKW